MGAAWHPCCDKPISEQASEKLNKGPLQKQVLPAAGTSAPSRQPSKAAPGAHGGQTRASLQVKDGGFGLANFNSTNSGRIEDFYDLEKRSKLGEGGFGSVRRCKDKRTGRYFAVKTIRKKAVEDVRKLQEEFEIMRLLDHPNIIRFEETFQDNRQLQLVLELCEGGELIERVTADGSLTEAKAAYCARSMLLAINYLHQNAIMHRDLKPENWLFSTQEEIGKSPLKLIDFGLAKRFTPGTASRTKAGTPNYIAPEVLTGKYDEKVDIWSIGVIVFLLLSGKHPFTGKTIDQVLQKVKGASFSTDNKYWKDISHEAKAFVQSCLQKTPLARPPADKALRHGWLEKQAGPAGDSVDLAYLRVDGLAAYGRMNKVKKAVLTVIATQLPEENIQTLKSMFFSMDKNSDGTLTVLEIEKALTQAGVELPADIQQLLKQVDTDGSGVVDYTEFLAATLDKQVYAQEDIVWNAFRKFDLDNNGTIDAKELEHVLGDDAVDTMIKSSKGKKRKSLFSTLDLNKDGVIDFEEFFAMIRNEAGFPSRPERDAIQEELKDKEERRLKGIVDEDEEEPQDSQKAQRSRSFRKTSSLIFS
eukprot:TRINITY_DN32165_c0_g1_i1.p1 TRINITY_DN32165_c0_g1~~TRINITY_DN32165_c0_g1_i1.p1  ORF type:complete len:587 (+),score=147.27 TRINITY_DN32165_c0_g1_i1:82-1842(+)